MRIFKVFVATLLLYIPLSVSAQEHNATIQSYLQNHRAKIGLNESDISNWIITDQYFSKSTGITSVHIQQTHNGIPVQNAVANFAIKDNKVVHFANRLIPDINTKASGASPQIGPTEAVSLAAAQLDLGTTTSPIILDAKNPREVLVSKEGISLNDIPVKLVYQPMGAYLKLAWDLNIHRLDGSNWWSVRIDATTGNILEKNDWILSCTFPDEPRHQHTNQSSPISTTVNSANTIVDGAQYNVFAFPVESPNHGTRQLLTNPADAIASPYGWHDTDGAAGAEFTITRGNNVWAQDDFSGTNAVGYSPDGGSNLIFDHYYLDDNDPIQDYEDAAITNLFYVNNIMHDVWYNYGFDEAAGNFQATNYTGEGAGDDFVYADAHDGSGVNNATFGTPPEGYNPSMQMFLWNPVYIVSPLTVNNSSIAGTYQITDNDFNPGHIDLPLSPLNITADLVLALDGTPNNLGCNPFTNASAMAGKIAVVRRGSCTFVQKVLNAQNAGAVAVIVVNNEGGTINMGGDGNGVQIPAVSMSMSEGEALISAMQNTTINITLTDPHKQIVAKDGSFDNVIIAHEYGHGISNRLTGGPINADCLYNAEQMGEGWSDWFGLMLTLKAEDVPEAPRGIGTYVASQPTTGNGIRNAPYSTSFSVNNYTYGDTNNTFQVSQPHGIGFVWSSILWDLTWALIDEHGFDPDLYNGTGGNNIAMQLVIDGLKLQPCNPGFVDGRDAILAADMAANDGANQCTIWAVFANRGVGYGADQGSSHSRNDQTENFDMPPSDNCFMGTTNFETQSDIRIFPNPSNGLVNVQSTLQETGPANFQLFDLNGRLIYSEKIELGNNSTLDVSHLSAGVYVVKISGKENTFTQKLIIQ